MSVTLTDQPNRVTVTESGVSVVAVGTTVTLALPGVVNVQSYGALGDGSTDDTAAIQAALAAVAAGGTVYFPRGTYLVTPASANAPILTIPGPNIHICGAGIGQSVVKVKTGSLPYHSVLRGTTVGTDLSGLELDHLSFDANVAGNPIANLAELANGPRITLSVSVGLRINVHDCQVLNSSGVNDISLNGTGVGTVMVTRCFFTNLGDDPNHVFHDASAIYVHASGVVIAQNQFASAGVNVPAAVTAIETHGSDIVISDNVVRDFPIGMNVTGIAEADSSGLVIKGNVLSNVALGIHVWSSTYGAHGSGYGIDGCVIAHNTIRLAETSTWSVVSPTLVSGIWIDANATLDVRGLKVHGNTIMSPLETQVRTANTASLGIGWISSNNCTLCESDISDNTVIGFPMAGVRLSCNLRSVTVRGNVLVNVGSTLDGAITVAYRCPIFIGCPTLAGLLLDGNVIVDSNATTRTVYAMYLAAPSASADCHVVDNVVRITGATQTAFLGQVFLGDNVIRPYLRGVWASPLFPSVVAAYQFAPGSEVIDPSTGRVYRLAADNFTWAYQPLLATGVGATVDQVIAALQARGIVRQS